MTAILIRRDPEIQELFVGDTAPIHAARWAIDALLGQYSDPQNEPLNLQAYEQLPVPSHFSEMIRRQGLVHPNDLKVLSRMLYHHELGQHPRVLQLLAQHWALEVTQLRNVLVHLHVMMASGPGMQGSAIWVQLEHSELLKDTHDTLSGMLSDTELLEYPNVQHYQQLVHEKRYEEAHQHFLNSTSVLIQVELEEDLNCVSSGTPHTPRRPVRGTSPNLFTVTHALQTGDQSHLQHVPLNLLQQAETVLTLQNQYLELRQKWDEAWKNLNSYTCPSYQEMQQLMIDLSRNHLLPALISIDPNIDLLFHQYTGEHLLEALKTAEWIGGDHTRWNHVGFDHFGVRVNVTITSSGPGHQLLHNVGLQLAFEELNPTYAMSVQHQQVNVDLTRELCLLNKKAP